LRAILIPAAALAAGLAIAAAPGAALAGGPPNHQVCTEDGGYCASVGLQSGGKWAGIEGQWDDSKMEIPASESNDFGHLNNEMWLYANKANSTIATSAFVELGLGRGCDNSDGLTPKSGSSCSATGGINAYYQFYAWTPAAGDGSQYFAPIKNIDMDGDNHVYEIWDSSNCANDKFEYYVDYDLVATSPSMGFCNGQSLTAGMELAEPGGVSDNSGEYSGTFDNYIQLYSNSSGAWSNANFTSSVLSDTPTYDCLEDGESCITFPCAGNPADICLHGLRVAANEWQDDKPG
jgi:hypothetical protein